MEKLELWKQNEPLFADKLNDEVKTVNALIDKINNKQDDSASGSMSSISYPQFGMTRLELLQMWGNDGEGVVLSGHDFGFLGDAGLYARENEAVLNGQRFVPTCRQLKKIANYSELQENGILYQEITLTCGRITNSQLKYTNNELPENSPNTIYRKLSRIVTDCKSYSCGAVQGRFKAIAINETNLQNYEQISVTTHATTQRTACHDDYRYLRQTYKPFEDNGTNKNFFGLSNEGGLEFVYSGGIKCEHPDYSAYNGIRAGIEIYNVKTCGASKIIEPALNEDDPRPLYDKLASTVFAFPVKVNEYVNDGENWVLGETKDKGQITLHSTPVANNNWQIGFEQSGEIIIDTYKPKLTTEGTVDTFYCYDVKAKESDYNIIAVCKKQTGNKITYEIEGFYCFDPEFFVVTDCGNTKKVSLNTTVLYDLADEVVNDLAVNVQGCGLVEPTFKGQVVVSTNGTLTLNSEAKTI